MDIPILWKSFSALPPQNIDEDTYMSIMRLSIKLSRHYPLNFEAWTKDPDDQKLVTKFFPLLISEIDRWRSAAIILNGPLCKQLVTAPIGHEPLLEELTLDMVRCSPRLAKRLPAALRKFTRLRRIILYPDVYAPLLGMPWSQLTDIHSDVATPIDECVDILNECLCVVKCTMMSVIEPIEDIKPHNTILPSLVELHLMSEWDTGEIFSRLTCPSLAHLTIEYIFGAQTQSPNTLKEFVSRSSCKLESFALTDGGITESEIMSCMATPAFQSLKFLSVHGPGPSTSTVMLLKHEENRPEAVFMPALEELRLSVNSVPDGLFADMVASRLKVPGGGTTSVQRPVSLKSIDVGFGRSGFTRRQFRADADKASIRLEHSSDISRLDEFRRRYGLDVYYG